jgi:hypothetical protein
MRTMHEANGESEVRTSVHSPGRAIVSLIEAAMHVTDQDEQRARHADDVVSCDLADIGAKPRRVVHAHVVVTQIF